MPFSEEPGDYRRVCVYLPKYRNFLDFNSGSIYFCTANPGALMIQPERRGTCCMRKWSGLWKRMPRQAAKGGTNLGAFVYDYPPPMLNLMMPMEMDAVIDPFSKHSAVISRPLPETAWNYIQAVSETAGCTGPDWLIRSILP